MMEGLKRVRSLVAVSLVLSVLLVPAAWASGDVDLQQQGDGGDRGTDLVADGLVSVTGVGVRVSQSSDDAEEELTGSNTGRVRTGGGDLELGTDTGVSQLVGMRFASLGVPRYSTISDAYIEFTSKEEQTGTTNLTFKIEAADGAATYESDAFDISNRATLGSHVYWAAVPAWAAETVYRTPSLRSLVQEHVNRASWAPGNPLAFQVSGIGQRTAFSYDGDAAKAPKLIINYSGSVNCFSLTPTVSPPLMGKVTADPPPNCEGTQYYQDTVVELTAEPEPNPSASNYAFANWSGAATGVANPTTVTMTGNKSVTANYVLKTCYPLNTAVVPVLAPPIGPVGEIRPDPGFNCGGERYVSGTVLSMVAVARGGWSFAGWSGDLSSTVTPETLTMNGAKTVTAAFAEACRTIDERIKPEGGGTIEYSPPPNCTKSKWHPNAVVELRAIPAGGYFFVKWVIEGAEVWDNPMSVTMNSNKTVSVTFREGSYYLWLPAIQK